MKIKDILESIDSIKAKIYTAFRIYHCSAKIKEAIKKWKQFEGLPLVTILVESSEDEYIKISSYDLVNIYAFDELSALLMLDDIEKAQKEGNKEKLNDLLSFLTHGKHETRNLISDEMMEQIRISSPEIWEEYQKLCDNSAKKEKELEDKYPQIIETEL